MTAPVTVAVVSWNTRELLAACLRSLAPEHGAGSAEVWVVDNGSTDGSRELVGREFPWATLVESDDNLGFGAAVNLVAVRTESPWLVAANADVALPPGTLAALVAAAEADPKAGAVAPRLVLDDGTTQHSTFPFPGIGPALALNSGIARFAPALGERLGFEGYADPARARVVDWAIGALLLLRREAFDAAGGFDERHWIYAEDIALGRRIARAGFSTLYEPGAIVLHASGAATAQAFGDERRERFMAETYAWLVREHGTMYARAVAAINTAGSLVRLVALEPAATILRRYRDARADRRSWLRAHRRGWATTRAQVE